MHGVLLLDKPLGLSSNQALQRCKWLLRAEKAGHTGTLDPLATGVLPLCFGAATKFSQLQLDADKTYEATVRLGVKTSTGDAEGEVISRRDVPAITLERLAQVAREFTGAMRQVPPMHSALKKDGKALYEYARAGEEVDREPREILVHELQLSPSAQEHTLALRAQSQQGNLHPHPGRRHRRGAGLRRAPHVAAPHCHRAVRCSQCVTLEALEALSEDERLLKLQPIESLLPDHMAITPRRGQRGPFSERPAPARRLAGQRTGCRLRSPPARPKLLLTAGLSAQPTSRAAN